jgi:hypothetical protein
LKFDDTNGTIVGGVNIAIPAPPPTPSSVNTPAAVAGWRPTVSTSEKVARAEKARFIFLENMSA